MTYDPTAAYRSTQVTSSSPVAQVVLLYEGAIRFTTLSVHHLERHELEPAHQASLRAQAIVSALRETLDLSAGDVAKRLDGIYDFVLRRLLDGNVAKDPAPAREAIALLRELLDAWRAISTARPTAPAVSPAVPAPRRPTEATGDPRLAVAYAGGLRGAA